MCGTLAGVGKAGVAGQVLILGQRSWHLQGRMLEESDAKVPATGGTTSRRGLEPLMHTRWSLRGGTDPEMLVRIRAARQRSGFLELESARGAVCNASVLPWPSGPIMGTDRWRRHAFVVFRPASSGPGSASSNGCRLQLVDKQSWLRPKGPI